MSTRRNVVRPNLRSLIGVPNIVAVDIQHIQVVVGVGRLKPRTRVIQIDMQRVLASELKIHPVKYVLLVALRRELPSILADPEISRYSIRSPR